MTKYLIIGNGVAGTTAAEKIRENDPDGLITIVTKEKIPFYSRIKLPDFVAGLADKPALIIKDDKWYTDYKIELKMGTVITSVNQNNKQAIDQKGNIFDYDSLLIATGSNPFIPPVNGSTKDKVLSLRNFEDAENIVKAAAYSKNVVAIGGGLLGLEAAHALIKRGIKVIVVEFFGRLLPRQMDSKGALLLKKMLESQGFEFRLDAKTNQITGDQAATGVELESGEILKADMVLFSAGVRPDLDLPEKLGLETDRGVIVNSRMETGLENIYAAGDVAQFEQTNFCIWPEAQDQGRIAGANMTGLSEKFKPIVPSNRLKVAGIDLASAGDIDPDNLLENEIEENDHLYRKIVKKDGNITGCIMLGSTEGFAGIVRQIAGNAD